MQYFEWKSPFIVSRIQSFCFWNKLDLKIRLKLDHLTKIETKSYNLLRQKRKGEERGGERYLSSKREWQSETGWEKERERGREGERERKREIGVREGKSVEVDIFRFGHKSFGGNYVKLVFIQKSKSEKKF